MTAPPLAPPEYRDRVHGAWLGKLIGCAAGAPGDGDARPREITDYPAVLHPIEMSLCEGVILPRLMLEARRTAGAESDLAAVWLEQMRLREREYGQALANLRLDLLPPVSGVYNNPYRESLGALLRADIWGMLAPGDSEGAGLLALRDATLDHAGAGVEAAIVLAGLVGAAFAEPDPARLIELALRLVPRESRVARAVRDVARWHGELASWRRTREMLLRSYGSEDVREATVAMGTIALALLDGEGDFGRTVTCAAKCGGSTIGACAAAGAVLGAARGARALPEAWLPAAPASEEVLSLVELTCEIGLAPGPRLPAGQERLPEAGELSRALARGPYVVSFRRGPLEVLVDYETRPTIGYDTPRRLSFGIVNRAARSLDLRVRLAAPEGFIAVAGSEPVMLPEEGVVSFSASVSAPEEHCRIATVNACHLRLAVEEESEYSVPIPLVGESIWYAAGPYGDFSEPYPPEAAEVLAPPAAPGEAVPAEAGAPLPPDSAGEGEPAGPPPIAWRRLSVAEPAVNLLAGLDGEQGTYYLRADLLLDGREARPARLRVACNDGITAWLNGRPVLSHHQHRPADPRVGVDECDLELPPGRSRLTLKLAQCSPRRMLAVALADREGNMLALGIT